MNNMAILSNDRNFTSFSYNDKTIRFKTSSQLEKYKNVLEWDNGYIVVSKRLRIYRNIGRHSGS